MDPHDKIAPQGVPFGSAPVPARGGSVPDPTARGAILAGKYRVERVLGQGGMGVVVEARHMVLDDRVALKFLLPDFAQHPDASARFLREARAAVRIKSEHVARVSDVGTLETGAPYMVMEFLDGSDLGKVLTEAGPLAIPDAVDYIIQGCEAIAEAHGYGIVHRDLKPANLFLSKRPNGLPIVKVLDFGISKVVESAVDNLTGTTTSMGSALYMSPEQMQQTRGVDGRTDIYALGVSLYELLAGRQPFHAETLPQLCAEIFTGTPTPIGALRTDVPEALAAVMEKAYARDRGLRYQTIADFVVALAPFAPPRSQATIESVVRMGGLDGSGKPASRKSSPRRASRGIPATAGAPAAGARPAALAQGGTEIMQPQPQQGGTQLMKTLPRPARALAPNPVTGGSSDGTTARGTPSTAAGPREAAIPPSTATAAPAAPPGRGEAALVGALVGAIAVLSVVAVVAVRWSGPSPRSSAASAPAADSPRGTLSTPATPAVGVAPAPAPDPASPLGVAPAPAPDPASPLGVAPAPAPDPASPLVPMAETPRPPAPPVGAVTAAAAEPTAPVPAHGPEAAARGRTTAPIATSARAAAPVAPAPAKPAGDEPTKPRAAAPGKPAPAGRTDVGF